MLDSFNQTSLAPYVGLASGETGPCIMIYSPANLHWHWLALIGMTAEGPKHTGAKPGLIPRPIAMATARPYNRWRWHFWLMSRHCWVTAVTLGLAAEKQWRHHQCRTGIGVMIGSLCIYEWACVPEDVEIEIMWSIWVWNWHFTE